jgi:hypothetical protein
MYKNIALIFISFFFLISSIKEFGNMFLSIPSFLMLSYNLSDLSLKLISKKKTNHKKSKNFELISLIGVISIFFVIRDFEQTLGGYILFWKLAFFSLLFSICCAIILNHYYSFNNEKKFYNILGISICFFLLVPNICIFINKNFNTEVSKQPIQINYKKITKTSRGGNTYNIYIHTEFDKNERLDISEEFYDSISNNQKVVLTLTKGVLGYNYVQKIEIDKSL